MTADANASRVAVVGMMLCPVLYAAERQSSVTQYGITWTFDRPCEVGRFVTGDWWVVGPVTVVKVSPEPGKSADKGSDASSKYGAAAMKADDRMRNGSMVVEQCGGEQGYDSQLINYDAKLSVVFPCPLAVGRTLISTISNTTNPNPVLLKDIMWGGEDAGTAALRAAAVLTCLDRTPPPDSFRPPYAGRGKPLFSAAKLKWNLLPRLPGAGKPPDWAVVERWFQRPWLDHIESWVFQYTGPQENQPNYGREFGRATSIAGLMLMLDVPDTIKRPLVLSLVQMGIDNYGLVHAGRRWSADGGHWIGRKWPLVFASLMLEDQRLIAALGEGLFSEDQQTYFGTGFRGDKALWQAAGLGGPRPPYEEKDPATWSDSDKFCNGYRLNNGSSVPGLTLSTLMMKGKARWNHDAFFAYGDRWMAGADKPLPVPGGSGRADPFVQAMWDAYRTKTPAQPDGSVPRKWVWGAGGKGDFVIQGAAELGTAAKAVAAEKAVPDKTEAAPPVPPRKPASPEALAAWDARLRASVLAKLQAGRKPRFVFAMVGQPAEIVSLDDRGGMRLTAAGSGLVLAWSALKPEDKRDLAVGLASGEEPEDIALAAFYCLACGSEKAAEPFLRRLGEKAADGVREAFQ
jgi:hypothetical protein